MTGSKSRVFITRQIPANGIELLEKNGLKVDMREDELPPSREELLERSAGAAALVTLVSDRVDGELLDAAGPQLRVVANYAVGTDNIDVEACSGRDVVVTNTPDVLTGATATQAMMLLLAVARRVREGDRLVRSGEWHGWHPLQLLGQELEGSTLGIVGMGRIGTAMAKRATAFGMEIVYHNRKRDPEAEAEVGARYREMLPELLEESDFVSLHAPLTEHTRHIIDAEALSLIGPEGILVNTARGPLVDEDALVEALRSGKLWGAGLDVFEQEPQLAEGLAELDNVVLAPHLGSATTTTRRAMAKLCAQSVVEVLAGRSPDNRLN